MAGADLPALATGSAGEWHRIERVPREGMTMATFSPGVAFWYQRFAAEGATWLGISREGSPRQLLDRIVGWLADNHPARVDRPMTLRVGVLLGEAFRGASNFRWGYLRVDGTPMLALLSPGLTHAVAPVDCLRETLYVGHGDLVRMFDCLLKGDLPPADPDSITLLW
jgi:hypothetical protein